MHIKSHKKEQTSFIPIRRRKGQTDKEVYESDWNTILHSITEVIRQQEWHMVQIQMHRNIQDLQENSLVIMSKKKLN